MSTIAFIILCITVIGTLLNGAALVMTLIHLDDIKKTLLRRSR